MRQVRIILLGFMSLCSRLAISQVQVVVQQQPELQPYGLSLIGYESPQFQTQLRSILGTQDAKVLEPVLPFSVILTNTGNQTLAVIGVRFQMVDQSGRLTQNFHYTEDLSPHLSINHVRPGESRLVAIIRLFSDAVSSKTVNSLPMNPTYVDNVNVLGNYRRMKSITVTLDSVAFDNGEFVGPDAGDEYLRLTQMLASEQNVCNELNKSLASGVVGVRQTLMNLSSAKEYPRKDLLHWDAYTRRQVNIARGLLGLLDQQGLAVISARIDQCAATSARVQLRRVPKGDQE